MIRAGRTLLPVRSLYGTSRMTISPRRVISCRRKYPSLDHPTPPLSPLRGGNRVAPLLREDLPRAAPSHGRTFPREPERTVCDFAGLPFEWALRVPFEQLPEVLASTWSYSNYSITSSRMPLAFQMKETLRSF